MHLFSFFSTFKDTSISFRFETDFIFFREIKGVLYVFTHLHLQRVNSYEDFLNVDFSLM